EKEESRGDEDHSLTPKRKGRSRQPFLITYFTLTAMAHLITHFALNLSTECLHHGRLVTDGSATNTEPGP
ncbi:MAG: hypothetical protein WCP86_08120, partial [bacterium]